MLLEVHLGSFFFCQYFIWPCLSYQRPQQGRRTNYTRHTDWWAQLWSERGRKWTDGPSRGRSNSLRWLSWHCRSLSYLQVLSKVKIVSWSWLKTFFYQHCHFCSDCRFASPSGPIEIFYFYILPLSFSALFLSTIWIFLAQFSVWKPCGVGPKIYQGVTGLTSFYGW